MIARSLWWVIGPLLVAVGCHAAVLVFELLLQRVPLRSVPVLAAREMIMAWRTFLWRMPFRAAQIPDSIRAADGRAGVVLIHGLFCNRGLWNSWMAELRRRDIPFTAINLKPPFASIDTYLATVESAVTGMNAMTGRHPVIVGHSMGGIAARAWCADLGKDRFHRIVTIGSPHHGTVLSRFSRATNAREMGRDSAWLRQLAGRESGGGAARFTCFYSDCDNVVIPWTSACLPGADNRRIIGRPHLAMLDAPELFDEVLRLVQEASAAPD